MNNWDLYRYNRSTAGNALTNQILKAVEDKTGKTDIAKTDIPNAISDISVEDIITGIIRKTGREFENITSDAETVAKYAYQRRILVKSISLPVATSIGDYAMQNCLSLVSIDLPMATSIGTSAVQNCLSLVSINLPNATSIGTYAMYNCLSLVSINLPNATSIGDYAMHNCLSLVSIDLPMATSIGTSAVQNCLSLTTLILGADTVCTLAAVNALAGTPIADGTGYIYVPQALVEDYKTATNWATYAKQIRAIEDYPEITGG